MTSETPVISDQEEFVRLVLRLRAQGVHNARLYSVLEKVSRRSFFPSQWAKFAYSKGVFPLGCGQYIEDLDEQIHIIHALSLEPGHRVLEIGTGSGFTAAILAYLSGRVTTIDRYRTLVESARQRFQMLRLDNIILRYGDALTSLGETGPFDRILIWCSLLKEPRQFLDLLADNGKMIVPIGMPLSVQTVICYTKTGAMCASEDLFKVRYQPFITGISKCL